jgi:hypothetical protein
MRINLKGGPFDGQTLQSDQLPPQYIVPSFHPEHPIYQCTICQCCAAKEAELTYVFKGYDYAFERPAKRKRESTSSVG